MSYRPSRIVAALAASATLAALGLTMAGTAAAADLAALYGSSSGSPANGRT